MRTFLIRTKTEPEPTEYSCEGIELREGCVIFLDGQAKAEAIVPVANLIYLQVAPGAADDGAPAG